MRRELTHFGDGSFRLEGPQPSLAEFVTHAKRYGTAQVYETASMSLGPRALARLRIELDAIEASRKSGSGFTIGKRRRRSRGQTREAVVQLSVEGFVVPAIADKLGISDKTVRNYLSERPQREARE
jgi:hypothetical protein